MSLSSWKEFVPQKMLKKSHAKKIIENNKTPASLYKVLGELLTTLTMHAMIFGRVKTIIYSSFYVLFYLANKTHQRMTRLTTSPVCATETQPNHLQ